METKPRILIVDDEPDFTEALEATLRKKSYQVLAVNDRHQAEGIGRGGKSLPRAECCECTSTAAISHTDLQP